MSRYATLTKLSTELAWAETLGHHETTARLRRATRLAGAEVSYNDRFKKALSGLDTGLTAGATELHVFDKEMREIEERGGIVKPGYVRDARARILRRIGENEATARRWLVEAQTEALTEAREVRAAHEASRNPQERIAEEMERARLVASPTTPDVLAQRASDALSAKQPRRAQFLLDVALDKGYKGTFATDPETGETISTLPALRRAIADSLDASEPDLQRARALEESVSVVTGVFNEMRDALLAQHGLGIAADGTIGEGRTSQVAVASLRAKGAAFRHAQERGTFIQPEGYAAPNGVLPSAPKLDQFGRPAATE